mmetsp:Transcript_2441/g.3428  ORF Transcript_2441/g.3428 Transcript_2441/m.3428 type:complete len:402 (+) Transcript_2441:1306-2511(+)
MEHLGFCTYRADPDVWMRPAVEASDGTEYWEYVLLYIDDASAILMNAKDILNNEIGKYWTMKKDSIGPPTVYLGNKVSKVSLENGVSAWAFSSSQYIQSAVSNVEEYLKKTNKKLPTRACTPFPSNYRPEIDITPKLNATRLAYYQSLIGILCWVVELGRIDITCKVLMMASMMALPREGHLQTLLHIFGYLKAHHNIELVLDHMIPDFDVELQIPRKNWRHTLFVDAKEIMPDKMPPPRGLGFTMIANVDSDHTGDEITRRSCTGFIVFLNNSPIYWFSKKQNGIETSSFGSEFIAPKQCCEYICGLQYKLHMMGIEVNGPAYIYGDNKSVLSNASVPESVFKKKSNSIAYNFVREGSSSDEWRVTYVNTNDNVANLPTKPLSGEKRKTFTCRLLYHLYS